MRVSLAFKIAWRNIWRHKGKSLVIGFILFFGAVLMTVGNGMLSGMEQGLSENIINLFSGDIVLISNQQEKNAVLFDVSNGKPLKVIKNYDEVKTILEKENSINRFLPATGGMVFVLNSGSEMGRMMLMGVDIEKYREMFPGSFKITEGRMLKPGERGVLVSEEARRQSYDSMDFWTLPQNAGLDKSKLPPDALHNVDDLDVRRDLVFMGVGASNSFIDIRVPVTGIMNFKSLNKVWGMYSIVDIESFREAHNYLTGTANTVTISSEQKKYLENDQLDEMFSGDMVTDVKSTGEAFSIQDIQKTTRREEKKVNADSGSYNLVFLKLEKGASQQAVLQKLNEAFHKNGLEVRAISWKDAVGMIGSLAMMIKGGLNLFILFIFFVAIIVIMNTLSMAALERVSEIGMMRAIGARKGFLGKMFVYETGILSFFFGGLGIIVGIIIIYLIKAAGISTANEIGQLVYGGDRLNPIFTMGDLILGLFELAFVTFLAVLYPLKVVGKIEPLDAIIRE